MRTDNSFHFKDSGGLTGGGRPRWRILGWKKMCAGALSVVAFTCIAQDGRPVATGSAAQDSMETSADSQTADQGKQSKPPQSAADETQRKKAISVESTQLLAMAVALKAEVDKTNKDMLSLNVIRKADEIEKLAHTVKEKTK